MTLMSLKHLRDYAAYIPLNMSLQDYLDEVADVIQAEVDADYIERKKALYDTLIPLPISDWCMEHQSDVEGYIKHFYLPLPIDTDGNPVQKGTRYKATRKDSHGTDYVDVDNLYITVVNNDTLFYHSTKWDFERIDCDSQERIDNDATLPAALYCHKHDIDLSYDPDYEEVETKKVLDLLRRQRKLMGGEA